MSAPEDMSVERERAPTVTATGARRWLYPDRRPGPWAKLRGRLAILLLLIYGITPWLEIGGRPVLRVDILAGQAYVFGAVFKFSDAGYLAFIALILAVTLFLVTSVRGRIWCGFACPQTVFVEWVVRPIEEWVEGNARRRQIQDQGPMTLNLALRKLSKHILLLGVSAGVANIFLAYFIPPSTLLHWMTRSPAEHPWAFAGMSLVLAVFYLDLAWFREQFCAFLCPYARFQSVMLDAQTPAVAYDARRGDPRGRRAQGDCIDCELCVRVCPTGIDIRNGLQLECIQCLRCADACDGIMTTLKRPLGLIRMASADELSSLTESAASEPASGVKVRFRWRLRPLLYAALLALLVGILSFSIWRRPLLELTITRQPGTTYSTMPDGSIGNMYILRAVNYTSEPRTVNLRLESPAEGALLCGACAQPIAGSESARLGLVVTVPATFAGKTITLVDLDSGKPIELSFWGRAP